MMMMDGFVVWESNIATGVQGSKTVARHVYAKVYLLYRGLKSFTQK